MRDQHNVALHLANRENTFRQERRCQALVPHPMIQQQAIGNDDRPERSGNRMSPILSSDGRSYCRRATELEDARSLQARPIDTISECEAPGNVEFGATLHIVTCRH